MNDADRALCADTMRALSNPEGINQYPSGGSAKFEGKSADDKFTGSGKVTIINPHSNASSVTHTDKKGRQYEGATRHLPTATVELDRGKRGLAPLRFEAYHHSLSKG